MSDGARSEREHEHVVESWPGGAGLDVSDMLGKTDLHIFLRRRDGQSPAALNAKNG